VYSWVSKTEKDVPVRRVFDRCAMVFAVVLFIALRKRLKSRVMASINPKQNPPGKPFIGGFLIGLLALLVVAGVMALLGGGRFINPHAASNAFWSAFGAALGVAVVVGVIEEILFRGIVFQGLQADLGTGLATILGAAFFALVHFLRPREPLDVSGSDPLGGFKVLIHGFDRFSNFSEILPFAIGLFLIGVLLTVAYLKTSALYLPMGLHGSLVFFSKLDRVFFEYGGKGSPLLFGSPDPYPPFLKGVDALLTWIMIVGLTTVMALLGHKLQSRGGEGASSKKAAGK
jgi:membrane protease YdiL (CAAX protease family)